jgi:hypothetical protein
VCIYCCRCEQPPPTNTVTRSVYGADWAGEPQQLPMVRLARKLGTEPGTLRRVGTLERERGRWKASALLMLSRECLKLDVIDCCESGSTSENTFVWRTASGVGDRAAAAGLAFSFPLQLTKALKSPYSQWHLSTQQSRGRNVCCGVACGLSMVVAGWKLVRGW